MAGSHREEHELPRGRAVARVAGIAGLIVIGIGGWAFLDPRSFFDNVATFPPFNEHLLHDIGAFEIGLGAVLVIAAFERDSLVAAFAGVGVGMAVHAVSHAIDTELGTSPGDPWIGAVVALALLGVAAWRLRAISR